MNSTTLLSTVNFCLGGVVFLLGLVILRENPRQQLNRVVALMLFFGGLGSIIGGLSFLASHDAHATMQKAVQAVLFENLSPLWEFFFPTLLLFACLYPDEHPIVRRVRSFGTLIFTPYAVHLGLTALAWMSHGHPVIRLPRAWESLDTVASLATVGLSLMLGAHRWLFSLVNVGVGVLTAGILLASYRRVAVERIRHQLRTIGLGLVACLVFYISASSLPLLFNIRLTDASRALLVLLALTVGSGSIAFAIVQYKFLDAKLLARRGILYAVACAVLVGVYLGVITQARTWLVRVTRWDASVLEPVFLVVALILFQPALARLEDWLERAFLRDPGDYRNVLGQLGADVLTTLDLDQLMSHSIITIADALLLRDAHLVAFPPGAPTLVRSGAGDAPTPADIGALRGAVLALPLDRPLRLSEPSPGFDAERRRLLENRLHGRLLIPLRAGDDVLGALVLGEKHTRTGFTSEDVQLLAALARQMAVSLQNAFLVRSRVEVARYEEELELARKIQRAFLMSEFPRLRGFDIHAMSQPAKHVGGDLYDVVVAEDDAFYLAIADVSGKGMPAALLSAMLQAAVRTQAGPGASVRQIVARTNSLVYGSTAIEQFATFVLARVDTAACTITFTNAGHNYPLLLRASGECVLLDRGGILLGIQDPAEFEEVTVPLRGGDRLVFYTDGLSEAVNAAREQYGDDRLTAMIAALPAELSAREMSARLMDAVGAWIGDVEPGDDCTVLVLRVLEPEPAGADDGAQLTLETAS